MGRNEFKGIKGVFTDIAHRKKRAALARNRVTRGVQEDPRSVYLAACPSIAADFLQDGYKYARSGPHFSRKGSPFSFRISFQSSHHNVPGEHVALSLAGRVTSGGLKAWRTRQATAHRKDDWVAGGMGHLLGTSLAYVEWDLANAAERAATIADLKRFVREVVMTYFARFSDPGQVIKELTCGEMPAMELACAIEFALCFGTFGDAQRILDGIIGEHAELRVPALEAVARFREKGIPEWFLATHSEQAAFAAVVHGLSIQEA